MSACRILIVDDEALARGRIRELLSGYPAEFEVREAVNGIEALDLIRSFQPNLLFLDIEMPGLTGFEVLAQIEEKRAKIIFQTAYSEFAIRAFEESACDYLLKPFSKERFQAALTRALHAVTSESRLQALEQKIMRESNYLKKIVVKQGDQRLILKDEEILFFRSLDHYTFAHTPKNEVICDLSLNHLEERLDPHKFRRLHRSHIVQLGSIAAIHSKDRKVTVTLVNGITLPISRNNFAFVRNFIK